MEDLTTNIENPTPTKVKGENANMTEIEIKEKSPVRIEDPEAFFNEGKENLRKGEISQAIKLLCKALELATKTKGDLDISLYEYYYEYADALLIQIEKENEGKIFGDAVPEEVPLQVADENEKKEENDENEKTEEKDDKEKLENNEEGNESGSSSEEESNSEEDEIAEDVNVGENNKEESDENQSSKEEGGGEEESKSNPEEPEKTLMKPENEDEPSDDLQIAWECLESARVILVNDNSNPQYLIKVIRRIGDLLSYKEDFDKAAEEYSNVLQLLCGTEGLGVSRNKAEIYFLIGNNFLMVKGKETESAENFEKSLENLYGVLNQTTDAGTREELNQIIKDVSDKRDDALEQKQSINSLKELEVTPFNQFDQPSINTITDLGVISKKAKDSELPEKNDDKKPLI